MTDMRHGRSRPHLHLSHDVQLALLALTILVVLFLVALATPGPVIGT